MRIICDTNIWYNNLGESYRGMAYTLTYISAHELATTRNLNNRSEDRARLAIRQMMSKSQFQLFLDPHRFLIGEGDPEDGEQVRQRYPELLSFLHKFANGHIIDPAQVQAWTTWREERDAPAQYRTDRINELLTQIRPTITDPEEYIKRSLGNPDAFRNIVCRWVGEAVGRTITQSDIDWDEFELFETVGRYCFLKLETTPGRMFQKNDYFDFWNLVYVSKRDLYWLKEDWWEDLIHECGLSHYLFRPRRTPNL